MSSLKYFTCEDYFAHACGLVGDENCLVVQLETHMVFECQHHSMSLCLPEQYGELSAAPACGITPSQSLFLFVNQHMCALSVARFVEQVQCLMDTVLRAPTDSLTTFLVCFFHSASFPAKSQWASCLSKVCVCVFNYFKELTC